MNERERVEHPSWCDRDLCTAPEFRPTLDEYRGSSRIGAHVSAPVKSHGTRGELELSLWQGVTAWDTNTFLSIECGGETVASIGLGDGQGGVALYALLGMEVKELVRKYPELYAERFPYVQRAIEDEADEATADASMPRDPVELEEQMADEVVREAVESVDRAVTARLAQERAFIGCDDCGSVTTCAPAERCWRRKPEAYISKEPRVSYRLTVNAEQRAEGTLTEVRAVVAELVTKRLEEAPERVALDAQTLNMAFNEGAVQESLDLRGDWYTVFDAYGEEPLRIRVTREE